MARKTFIALSFFGLVLVAGLIISFVYKPNKIEITGAVVDESNIENKLINTAKNTEEGRAFLEKYPSADIKLDNSGRLAIDFRIDNNEKNYLRLRVFVNGENSFIECYKNGVIEVKTDTNIILKYLANEECLI